MKIIPEEIEYKFDLNIFYTRLKVESEEGSKKATVIAGATKRYVDDNFKDNKHSLKKQQWLKNVIKKWNDKGEDVFKKEIHYDSYAISQDGKERIEKFLCTIKP